MNKLQEATAGLDLGGVQGSNPPFGNLATTIHRRAKRATLKGVQ